MSYATPWGSPYDYAINSRVNEYNDCQSALLKDVRKVNNIWRYLRDGYLGKYWATFERQFYLTYDYLAIGFDSEEEFAYRLAARLENVETEYVARLNSEDLIKNPLVSRIIQDDQYGLQSERTKRYDVNNGIHDRIGVDQRSVLGITTGTDQHNMNEASRGARDNHEQRTQHRETIGDTVMLTQDSKNEVNGASTQRVSNSSGQGATDNHTQATSQAETMLDNTTTTHNLERFADTPQNSMLTTDSNPIGWNGTAGAGGTKSDLVHFPKAEKLVALPWNEGYQTTSTLTNNAHTQHNTTGHESKDNSIAQTRNSNVAAEEESSFSGEDLRSNAQGIHRGETTTGEEGLENQIVQSRRSEIRGLEEASIRIGMSQNNNQGLARNQGRDYSDRIAQTALIHDNEQSRQLIGLEGRTVGSVWAEWQDIQKFKNAIGDLVNEARPCFLIVA